jgi:hypothetical protein
MAISDHLQRFAGKPVHDFNPAKGIADPTVVYRVGQEGWGEEPLLPRLQAFLNDPRVGQVPALVIGCWSYEGESPAPVVAALVAVADKLPNLRALFFGDITYEEQEISWINNADLSALFPALPQLEELWVRGDNGLSFGTIRHDRLRALAVEGSGLPAGVVREICGSELPALEHLELWLGTPEYGADTTVADLEPLLSGRLFPRLISLGLRDCEYANELAAAVVGSPLVRRLRVLDLSLGNLSDEGANALLELPAYAHLERLDIHHHYVSPELVGQLRKLPFAVNADDPQLGQRGADPGDRYIAHSE